MRLRGVLMAMSGLLVTTVALGACAVLAVAVVAVVVVLVTQKRVD